MTDLIEATVEEAGNGGVAAVDRCLSVLFAIESSGKPVKLSTIARTTALHKSTVLRLLTSLVEAGLVARLGDSSYVLGPAVMRLGLSFERANPLRHHLQPVLEWLVANDTESASFHIQHGEKTRLCVARVDSNHSTLDRVHAGQILPLYRGAAGRVILAFNKQVAKGSRVHPPEPDLTTVSIGERDPACAGMAAPVFSPKDGFVGALSLSGPTERFREADIARMQPLLTEGARRLTAAFGGIFPVGTD